MSMPSSNWATGAFRRAFQKTVTNVFYSRGISTRRRRSRRPAQQISLESLEPRQMLSVNPATSGSNASSANDSSNIAAFVSQNSIGILAVVPGSPTSVVAVSGNAQLAVTWTAPANTGGSPITDYLVKYSSNGGSTWTNFRDPVSTATSCSVTGLANGTSYVIKVVAKNAVGISPASANSAPATPATTVPGSPTSVVAVSRNASLAVTWAAPASTGGSPITDYLVKYSSNNGSTWTNFVHPVSTVPSLTVTGLANGTPYVFKVVAKNAVGISPASANSAPVTPATVPGSPTSVVAVSGNAQLAVTWTAPANTGGSPITNYLVKYSSNGGSTWTNFVHPVSTVPSLTVTGLINGTPYVFKVVAKNAVGISPASANSAPVTPALLAMSMVTVGNPGNAADANTAGGYGAVSYSYQIGKYDVTGSQYTAFLNAVGSTDTYGLYNASMGTDTKVAQISQSGSSGSYTYAVMNGTGSRPITYVSWWDGVRFANWMSNGQPSGAQTSTTTEDGTYYVNGATSGNAVAANATNPNTGLAPTFRIPLENEWYKAAYYSPNYGGSGVGDYYAYATQSDTVPGTTIGSSANQANYNNAIGHSTDVGSFSGSGSFYGTFDQTGNVFQWNDLDGTAGSLRGYRGGCWSKSFEYVSSQRRDYYDPSYVRGDSFGFRLASPVTTTLTPTFGSTTATADGFTVPITNYDSSYTWAGTATASGTVAVDSTGLATITGVAPATSSTATITTTKSNTVGGSATVTATSLVAMSMVTVGNAGNAADTGSSYPGYGAVSYSYQIGAYDVTGSQYTAFLNAVGSTDTYALYNASMGTDANVAQISQSGSSGSYTYAVMNSTGSRPISYVSWFDSARFSNWMSNGQPRGAQNDTTTEDGTYYVNGATSGNAVAANATNPNTLLAPTFRIPLENEWYKAAYYKGGSTNAGYWTYATQSNYSAPGTTIGSSANQANYNNVFGRSTDVGSFSGSGSFYGTFDQTGNVFQWNDLDGTAGVRGLRGGDWYSGSNFVSSSGRYSHSVPSGGNSYIGFRLAGPV